MENLGFDPPIGSTTSTYEIISLKWATLDTFSLCTVDNQVQA